MMEEQVQNVQATNPQNPNPNPQTPENESQQNVNPNELDWTMSDEQIEKLKQQAQEQVNQEQQPEQTQKQQLLAGKFKTEAELQKGLINIIQKLTGTSDLETVYKELEKVMGQGGLEAIESQEAETNENVPLDTLLDQYVDQFIETGEVPKELLEQTQAPPELVRLALQAKVQEYQNYAQQIIKYAGGEQAYQQLLKWADQNLKPEEKTAYAAALQTYDPALVSLVIDGIKARMQSHTPELIEGNQPATPMTTGFNSLDEAIQAINDPKYGTDARYTQLVQQKLLQSGFDMNELF